MNTLTVYSIQLVQFQGAGYFCRLYKGNTKVYESAMIESAYLSSMRAKRMISKLTK